MSDNYVTGPSCITFLTSRCQCRCRLRSAD